MEITFKTLMFTCLRWAPDLSFFGTCGPQMYWNVHFLFMVHSLVHLYTVHSHNFSQTLGHVYSETHLDRRTTHWPSKIWSFKPDGLWWQVPVYSETCLERPLPFETICLQRPDIPVRSKLLHFNIHVTEPDTTDHLYCETTFLWAMGWSFKVGSTVHELKM